MSETSSAAPIDLSTLSLDSFAGRPVAVLGLARSGVALCRFLADRGAIVTAYDVRPASELADALAGLERRPVRLALGPDIDPAAVLAGQALIATSPAVSSRFNTTEPRLRSALLEAETAGRVPVVSEIDLFLRLCPATTIGVTGTKGKTTTASLSAAVLEQGDVPVLLGGNIGTPLVERLPEISSGQRVVLELSELQLPTLSRGTDVSVYTHVTSDHLDRHGTLDAYRTVKRRLAELAAPGSDLVLNADDPVSSAFASASRARVTWYRRGTQPPGGVGTDGDWIVAQRTGRVMPLADIRLPGEHNVSNVLAAVAVGVVLGLAPEQIRAGVAGFTGVEHRLEQLGVIGGVRFVNDSMGTQPDAVIAALRSFEPPIVLIAGGRGKDVPLDELATEVAQRAAAVVLMGENAPELAALFAAAGVTTIERAADMAAAVARAHQLARELRAANPAVSPTVLLSPAAASFDMYADYAERGRAFRAAVEELDGQRATGGAR
jgi:UDP-N-acetylmuramoylalanine--D-glutamate ligase